MPGSIRVYVDIGGPDGVPHIFVGVKDASGVETYSGYAPVRSGAPVGAGRVSFGLTPASAQADANDIAGHMDQVAWASPYYTIDDAHLETVSSTISSWASNPSKYILLWNDCVNYVDAVVSASGANIPTYNGALHPIKYIPTSEKPDFFMDNEGNPSTGGNLNPTSLDPKTHPGTPAYDYVTHGGTAGYEADPVITESLFDDGYSYENDATTEYGTSTRTYLDSYGHVDTRTADASGEVVTEDVAAGAGDTLYADGISDSYGGEVDYSINGENASATQSFVLKLYTSAGSIDYHSLSGQAYLGGSDPWEQQTAAMLQSFGIVVASNGNVVYHPQYPVARRIDSGGANDLEPISGAPPGSLPTNIGPSGKGAKPSSFIAGDNMVSSEAVAQTATKTDYSAQSDIVNSTPAVSSNWLINPEVHADVVVSKLVQALGSFNVSAALTTDRPFVTTQQEHLLVSH